MDHPSQGQNYSKSVLNAPALPPGQKTKFLTELAIGARYFPFSRHLCDLTALPMFCPFVNMPNENESLSHQDSALLFITTLQTELAKINTSTSAPATARRDATGGQICRLKERKSTPPQSQEEGENAVVCSREMTDQEVVADHDKHALEKEGSNPSTK